MSTGHLVGVLSLRQLFTVPPNTQLTDIMTTEVISVRTDMDQEEVARVVEKYNILAVPVVDETTSSRVSSRLTTSSTSCARKRPKISIKWPVPARRSFFTAYKAFQIARLRLPWLLVNLFGGVITGYLMWLFKMTLKEVIALISFIPVITGMGGNVGGQSATIMVRGFATGRIDFQHVARCFSRKSGSA